MKYDQLPMGFGMALAMNPLALNAYSSLSEEQKETLVNRARSVTSREEMHKIINDLAKK